LVLTEFVLSDYARSLCSYCNVQPTDYGQIDGMFESVRLSERKIIVQVKRPFMQRSTPLLDRLALYLGARIPELVAMQTEERWDVTAPPAVISTRSLH